MSRRIRFIPDDGALVEVTCRALQSRFLLRPGPTLDAIILGALARAQRRYAVRIIAFFFASNHLHLILEVDDARQLGRFMNYFLSKVAREIGRLTGWREKIFGRRYQAIQISDEPEAQIARLQYVLSHGCKENLVERLREWPGVHCVEALTTGKTLEGWWFDRTQEYLARRRGESFGPYQYATRETLELAPLPCWKHLPPEKRQELAAAMVSEIEAEAADRRERTGVPALGPAAILAQSPESRPLKTKRSPAPAVHAASRAVRRELRNAYFLFVAAYRSAAEKLRAGHRDPPFPMGCFPPPLPFVGG
jgi:REP element-mobilizing transposase RayT